MTSDGAYCRLKEDECAYLAKAAISGDVKVSLLKLKRRWLEGAAEADVKNPAAYRAIAQRARPPSFHFSE